MFGKSLYADLWKTKGTSVILVHILIPVIVSGVFLLYYSFSPWDIRTKVTAFYQAVGAGLPSLLGIFTASVMEQEQNAGGFQNMLSLPDKRTAFLSKLSLLLSLGLFSVLLTAIIFGYGFERMAGNHTGNIRIGLQAAFVLWGSSIPLYIWQMILAFQFGKGVSVSAGILSSLTSALMLTGLGDYIWKLLFVSWTGRIPFSYLKMVLGEAGAGDEFLAVIPYYCIFTVISIVCYLLWTVHFEGSKITE